PTRTNAIQVAIDIQLQQIRRVVGRASRSTGLGAQEAQLLKIQTIHKHIDEPNRSVSENVVLQAGGKQLALGSVRTLAIAHVDRTRRHKGRSKFSHSLPEAMEGILRS